MRWLSGGPPAASQGIEAGQELAEGIGLGQVVVSAGVQSLDAVVHLAEGTEHQHGRFPSIDAQHAHQGQSVPLGQHAIEDQDIVLARQGQM
jgi:hypothetical protein